MAPVVLLDPPLWGEGRSGFWGRRVVDTILVAAIFFGTILVVPGVPAGASFDCSKVRTKVEKIICASEALSNLDEQLGKVYRSAIQMNDNPVAIKAEQRDWLRNIRDRCGDADCLKSAYEARLVHLTATEQAEWKTFRDVRLGIEFSYPNNRKVKIGCHGSKNCVALMGEPMPGGEYLIAFEVFDGELEKVAVEKAVFDKNDKGWLARGRSGVHPVESMAGPGWQGVKTVVDCGVADSNGFHARAGECLWGVLSDGKRSVVVDTQGLVGNDEVSMRSIQSLRFCE